MIREPSDAGIMFEWSQTPSTGDMRVDLVVFARKLLSTYGNAPQVAQSDERVIDKALFAICQGKGDGSATYDPRSLHSEFDEECGYWNLSASELYYIVKNYSLSRQPSAGDEGLRGVIYQALAIIEGEPIHSAELYRVETILRQAVAAKETK